MKAKPVVLAIDDEEMFREIIKTVLTKFGLVVHVVSRAAAFIEAAKRLKPDLYLIDMKLDKTMGFEIIEALRVFDKKSPIIVVSGLKEVATISQALELGANDFISKPVDRDQMILKISRYLTSEEIEDHISKPMPISGPACSGRLSFDVSLTEIDEFGLKMTSPHMIPKGTVMKIKTPLFEKYGLGVSECLVVITQTSKEPGKPDSQLYSAYAEFDGVNLEFLQKLRHWLMNNSGKTPV